MVLACVGCGCIAAIVCVALAVDMNHAIAALGAGSIVEILNLAYHRVKKGGE